MNLRLVRRLMPGFVVLLTAGVALAGPFSVSADHQLKVDWNGSPLVSSDELLNIGPDSFMSPESSRTGRVGDWEVHNLWKIKDAEKQITYRREAAVNDREVEVTIQFRVPAYFEQPKGGTNAYVFSIPVKALDGMSFTALTGQPSSPKELSGKITADMPDGNILNGDYVYGNATSFIAFTGHGKHLVIDFNPKGPAAFNTYGPTDLQGMWTLVKKGDQLRCSFGRSPELFGGVLNGKVRITQGTFDDYSKWHAHRKWAYYSELPTIGKPLEMKAGAGEKTLDVDVPQPGIYLFTVRNELAATGPFTLDCDGQAVAKDVSASQGKMQTITFSRYTQGKQIKLTWHGKWAKSTVAVQALMYKAQDFAFKRGVWLADNIPTPTNLFMFDRTVSPTGGWTHDGQSPPAVIPPAKLAHAKVPPGKVNVPSPDDPNRAWRWDGSITGLGPANFGSFYEFDTDALINRRLDELHNLGYRIILLNGLLFRHCWVEQLPHVEKTVARIVELAHQRGMKVLDHQDLTVVPYRDAGFNLLVDHLDWTQRDVRTGVPTRGWCLDNPNFQAEYWKYITEYVKNTGLDGLMIDEATFHGEMFCGCEYCREKFHHDTGLYLPYSGKDLMNRNSRLWKLWLSWRIKTVGDWWVDLRDHLQKVNPNIVLMKYTSPYGMISNYAFVGFGGSLPESSRAVGFLGTEIMTRNVYATYRNNLADREIYNSLRYAHGSPIFGLVYPIGQPAFAYSGWIQNNMRAQVTWAMTGNEAIEKDAHRYSPWKENMDVRQARPVARIAVVYSLPSITFPSMYGHGYALEGTAEQLDDQHAPYQVILNQDLTPQKLQKFDVLILPSTCCMSDAELSAVHAFLMRGGKVMSIGHSGVLDELGDNRKSWPIGSWIGLDFNYKLTSAPVTLSGSAIGGSPLDFPQAVMQIKAASGSGIKPHVLAQAQVGAQAYVAIAQGRVGKGTLLVVTPRIGELNCQKETTAGAVFAFQYNPQVGALFTRLVDGLRGDEPLFKAVSIPTDVRISVYEQPAGEGKTMTLVHLYNGSGVKDLITGQKVPEKQPATPFPPVEQDLVFDITLPQSGDVSGRIVSPDFSGERPAKVESIGNHRYRVTIHKGDLIAYDMVKLQG